jgi:hypothetical protein
MISNINLLELKLRQEIIHVDLQTVVSDMVYMHRLTLKIEDDIEF